MKLFIQNGEKNMITKEEIFQKVKEYYVAQKKENEFIPGERINYAGRVYDEEELINAVDAALDFWLTAGKYTNEFEKGLAEFLNVPYCSLVNSGSSANLIAMTALTSPLLKERKVCKGDEVITVAAAFPTTVAPIIQSGAVPVFVDIDIPAYNIDVKKLEQAISNKTKAIFVAHSLGNIFDLKTVKEVCLKHNLWLIEDNCDALGGEYTIDGVKKKTGTIGDIGTSSFYPAHQMTMGEGGAVYTSNPILHKIIRSLRDWGRDCTCPGGMDNTCGHRFSGQYGSLPAGYDHKYVYSHLGYNLKVTDLQAAIGCAQLKKLPNFIAKRRENWQYLREQLECLKNVLILPEKADNAEPCWFGFIIAVRNNSLKTADELVTELERYNIQTRRLFAGNILRHPCFENLEENKDYRIVGSMENTDFTMNHAFWVGVYPGMTKEKLDYIVKVIKKVMS